MSAVLQNELTATTCAHFACGRMFFRCRKQQALYDFASLLEVVKSVTRPEDAQAIATWYEGKFRHLPTAHRAAVAAALDVLALLQKGGSKKLGRDA